MDLRIAFASYWTAAREIRWVWWTKKDFALEREDPYFVESRAPWPVARLAK